MEEKMYLLTSQQKNIWNMEIANSNIQNSIFGIFSIEEILDLQVLEETINVLIYRNEATRTRLLLDNNEPKQYISEYTREKISKYIAEDKQQFNRIIKTLKAKSFDVIEGKLYDINIVQYKNTTYVCVHFHHIISDAWSMGQISEQIKEIYDKLINNETVEEKISYVEYIKREQEYLLSEKYNKDKEYWTEYIKQASASNNYNFNSFDGKRITKRLPKSLLERVANYCRENKVSDYCFWLSIIATYFAKVNSQESIVIGTPFINRSKANKELEVLGMFVSTLPVIINIDRDITFEQLCKNVSVTNMSVFKHAKFPVEQIQNIYHEHTKSTTALFDVSFSYQINKLENELYGKKGNNTWLYNGYQTLPILISYTNYDKKSELLYDYLLDCFDSSQVNYIHKRLIAMAEQVISKKDINVSDIEVLCDEDKEAIKSFNKTGNITITEDIITRFERIVKENSDNTCINYDNKNLTYNEFNNMTNYLANYLKAKGVTKNSVVSLILDNTPELIAIMIAVMKLGAIYVNILPEEVESRKKYIIEDSDSILYVKNNNEQLNIEGVESLDVEVILADYTSAICYPEIIDRVITKDDSCYMVYTSGTTGNPKGVIMLHKNIISLIESMNKDKDFKFRRGDTSISLLKQSFDAWAIDIYSMLLNGGKIVLVNKDNITNPIEVVKLIEQENVTRVFTVHKWIEQIQEVALKGNRDISSLRIIGTGAEILKPKKYRRLLRKYSNINLFNTYGPTETAMFITKHKVSKQDINTNKCSIGSLIPCSRALVINKFNEIMPIGVKGELIVYNDKLSLENISKGYHKLEGLTAQKYCNINGRTSYRTGDIVSLNEQKELEFYGRNDDLIKVAGGFLVALNEIENKVHEVLETDYNTSVISIESNNTNKIVLFVAKTNNKVIFDSQEIKKKLSKVLSYYMIPKRIIELDEIPLNNNGKTDRNKLMGIAKENEKESANTNVIMNNTEKNIHKHIKDILKLYVNIDDDFVDELNMDSLMLTMLYARLDNSKLVLQDLYTYSTIRQLAEYIDNGTAKRHLLETKTELEVNVKDMNIKNVLLTGANGFVGVHILRELVKNDNINKVYCLVREKDNKSANQRWNKVLSYYFDSNEIDIINKKAELIEGNILKSDLGIGEQYNELVKDIDTIINVAANVKHVGKYKDFYNVNVKSVENLLNICKDHNKQYIYISTISIAGVEFTGKKLDETTIDVGQDLSRNPYLQSKYEAEKIIIKACETDNINARIFRIGNIMPRIEDGKFQPNFEENTFLIAMKTFVDLEYNSMDISEKQMILTPVDECAKAIVTLLFSNAQRLIYHIESDKKILLDSLKEALRNSKKTSMTQEQYAIGKQYLKMFTEGDMYNCYSTEITNNLLKEIGLVWEQPNDNYIENLISILDEM